MHAVLAGVIGTVAAAAVIFLLLPLIGMIVLVVLAGLAGVAIAGSLWWFLRGRKAWNRMKSDISGRAIGETPQSHARRSRSRSTTPEASSR